METDTAIVLIMEKVRGIKTLGPRGGYREHAGGVRGGLLLAAQILCEASEGHQFTDDHDVVSGTYSRSETCARCRFTYYRTREELYARYPELDKSLTPATG